MNIAKPWSEEDRAYFWSFRLEAWLPFLIHLPGIALFAAYCTLNSEGLRANPGSILMIFGPIFLAAAGLAMFYLCPKLHAYRTRRFARDAKIDEGRLYEQRPAAWPISSPFQWRAFQTRCLEEKIEPLTRSYRRLRRWLIRAVWFGSALAITAAAMILVTHAYKTCALLIVLGLLLATLPRILWYLFVNDLPDRFNPFLREVQLSAEWQTVLDESAKSDGIVWWHGLCPIPRRKFRTAAAPLLLVEPMLLDDRLFASRYGLVAYDSDHIVDLQAKIAAARGAEPEEAPVPYEIEFNTTPLHHACFGQDDAEAIKSCAQRIEARYHWIESLFFAGHVTGIVFLVSAAIRSFTVFGRSGRQGLEESFGAIMGIAMFAMVLVVAVRLLRRSVLAIPDFRWNPLAWGIAIHPRLIATLAVAGHEDGPSWVDHKNLEIVPRNRFVCASGLLFFSRYGYQGRIAARGNFKPKMRVGMGWDYHDAIGLLGSLTIKDEDRFSLLPREYQERSTKLGAFLAGLRARQSAQADDPLYTQCFAPDAREIIVGSLISQGTEAAEARRTLAMVEYALESTQNDTFDPGDDNWVKQQKQKLALLGFTGEAADECIGHIGMTHTLKYLHDVARHAFMPNSAAFELSMDWMLASAENPDSGERGFDSFTAALLQPTYYERAVHKALANVRQ